MWLWLRHSVIIHLTLSNEFLITSVYYMQMSRCVSYRKCSSTLQRKQPSLIIQKVDDLPPVGDAGDAWWLQWMCVCVCVCMHWKSSIFPAVRSWQPLQASKVQRSPLIHAANSGSPPHLFTTWSSCAMLNITWQEAYYPVCVCVCGWWWWGVFPTALPAVRTFLIIIFFWNVTFQTQWPQADHS